MISPFRAISLIFEFIICIYKTKESNFQTQKELFSAQIHIDVSSDRKIAFYVHDEYNFLSDLAGGMK
jgi:hypothetical protein